MTTKQIRLALLLISPGILFALGVLFLSNSLI